MAQVEFQIGRSPAFKLLEISMLGFNINITLAPLLAGTVKERKKCQHYYVYDSISNLIKRVYSEMCHHSKVYKSLQG